MDAGAGTREGSRHADDVSVRGLELVGQVDLEARGFLHQAIETGNVVTSFHKSATSAVEGAYGRGGTGHGEASQRGAEDHCAGDDTLSAKEGPFFLADLVGFRFEAKGGCGVEASYG